MNRILLVALLGALSGCGSQPAADPQTLERGRLVFQNCMACHSSGADNKIGPGLRGVVGRTAGTMPGFAYSEALAMAGFAWDEERLVAFLSTENYVPGSNMAITPLSEEDARAVVAHLNGL